MSISSLPSWVASPFSLSVQPSRPATTAPVIITETGMATRRMTTRTIGPSMASSCPDVGPGFHLHEGAERQVGHADRRAGWAVVPEELHVDLVHLRVVAAEVAEEDRGLRDVGQRRPLALEQPREVGDGLAELVLEAAADELAVDDPDLAGHDEPLPGTDDGRVRTDRLRPAIEPRVVLQLLPEPRQGDAVG